MRNEALVSTELERVANSRSHWIIAFDANMDRMNSLGAIGLWSPELQLKLRGK